MCPHVRVCVRACVCACVRVGGGDGVISHSVSSRCEVEQSLGNEGDGSV